MPYAADGNRISQDPIEGGISITQNQYELALDGLTTGKHISIENGQMVIGDPPEPEGPTADQIIAHNIVNAPEDLFGGPTLEELFNGY